MLRPEWNSCGVESKTLRLCPEPFRLSVQALSHSPPALSLKEDESIQNRFDTGRRLFGRLIAVWMSQNDWSHPTMIRLATACLQLPGQKGWLHSSQIAGLRHATLGAPGPRAFVGIERLNYFLHRYKTEGELLPGTQSSNDYANPMVITEAGEPPALGWWVEVFCGYRVPEDIDLDVVQFTNVTSVRFSHAWAAYVRKLLIAKQYDVISDLPRVIEKFYPAKGQTRIRKLQDVIYSRDVWTPEELSVELPTITQFGAELGGPISEKDLLKTLEL